MESRKILVVVDLQRDFIDGSLCAPDAPGILPAIQRVKNDFDQVYFTLDWHPLNHCSFKQNGGPWPVHCVHHTQGATIPDSILSGMDENKITFILKGQDPQLEEYGAFQNSDNKEQALFRSGDIVTVCGLVSEYCVLETLKNIYGLALMNNFSVNVFLDGIASLQSFDTLKAFMEEKGIPEYK